MIGIVQMHKQNILWNQKKIIVFLVIIFILIIPSIAIPAYQIDSRANSNQKQYDVSELSFLYDDDLIINSGSATCSHGDSVSFDVDFPEPPVVVTCAILGSKPVLSSPTNVDANQFDILVIDHDGIEISDATVNWIAFYPSVFKEDFYGLMIQTGYGIYSNNDIIDFPIDFPYAPRVLTSANKDGIPVASSIRGHHDPPVNNFQIAILDHNFSGVSNADVFWVAYCPNFYENYDTNLQLEGRYELIGHNEYFYYNMVFPRKPYVVTNGYSIHNTAIAAPFDFGLKGFYAYIIDQNGNPDDLAWISWLAVYPYVYDERAINDKLGFFFGQISNVTVNDVYTSMNCSQVHGILFRPIHRVQLTDGKPLIVNNKYVGIITDNFIFGIFGRKI